MALVAAVMAVMSSCSSKEMLDLIPADVDFAIVGNLEEVIKNSGFEVTDNDIKGPAEMKAILNSIPNRQRDVITSLHSSIDCSRFIIMGYMASQPEVTGVAKITDADKFESILRKDFEASRSTIKGFDVYELGYRSYIVVNGNYAYIADGRSDEDAALLVNKFINRAEDKNITSVSSVSGVLAENNTVNVVCNMNSVADLMSTLYGVMDVESAMAMSTAIPYLKGNWLSISAKYTGTSLTVNTFLFNEESGDRVEYPGLKEIDTNALKLLPANSIAGVAFGIDNQTLRQQLQQLQKLTDKDPMLKSLIKQIGNLDGTVAAGIAIKDEQQLMDVINNGPLKADVTVVAQLRPGAANELKNLLVNLASMAGIETSEQGGMTKLSDGKTSFYLIVKGNDLIASTSSTVAEASNPIEPMLAGAGSGIAVNIPSFSKLVGGKSNIGVESSLLIKNDMATFEIKVNGADDSLIPAIMGLAGDMAAFDHKLYEQRYKDWNDYRYEPQPADYAYDSAYDSVAIDDYYD